MDHSFIAIDGDDVGNRLRNYIVGNDVLGASEYSKSLNVFFDNLAKQLEEKGCQIVFCGGDSVLAIVKSISVPNIISGIKNPLHPISIGIGKSAELSYLALQLAKARGKAQIVVLDDVNATTVKKW